MNKSEAQSVLSGQRSKKLQDSTDHENSSKSVYIVYRLYMSLWQCVVVESYLMWSKKLYVGFLHEAFDYTWLDNIRKSEESGIRWMR